MIGGFLKNFLIFSRPHTIIGTSLSVLVLFLLAWFTNDRPDFSIWLIIGTLIACLGANIYIVGLNQLTDIEIDKINKPYLPLASGYFSITTGYILIGIGLIISLIIALISSQYLIITVVLSLILGTAYSIRPFRLKRFYFWAAFCIIAVRGLIVNIFLYLHFQFELTASHQLPHSIILLTAAMFGYSLIIAWFKDVPDMEGDARFQIKTMSISMGASRVYLIGNILLTSILLLLAIIPWMYQLDLNPYVMTVAHIMMLIALWKKRRDTDIDQHQDVRKFYLFIWSLFFLEYISFSIAAGLNVL